ncbi:hypothetical protein O181_036558 [Austropuccinia psidii MF-1]|uniref:Chromo domain-containing protein n=1 Tax=Austropuccinia psidii MF-1 TaxID=1389203 RepID=A0A9Q3D9Q1_9BASI|nr:hypothetical protein [Austropuccinia psidii MF-1]
MNDSTDYEKQKWYNSHKLQDCKVGDLFIVSTLNFDNIKGSKKLKNSYLGPFAIFSLDGNNAVQVELSFQLDDKHPTLPVSLTKTYQKTDEELFPLRIPTPLNLPQVEKNEYKEIKKVIKNRRHMGKNQIEYLVRYRNQGHKCECLEESDIPDSDKCLRRFRHERRPQA